VDVVITKEMAYVLDHLLAETFRFGDMVVAEDQKSISLGPAHHALMAAGIRGAHDRLHELLALHTPSYCRENNTFEALKKGPGQWNASEAGEGIRQILQHVRRSESS
jgi:hypothetical protein